MRKDDPQINLRVPADLKEQIQEAAKKNQRTQTAEILARLRESLEAAPSLDSLMPASKAKSIAAAARAGIEGAMRKRIIGELGRAVEFGHPAAEVSFYDMRLELLPQANQEALVEDISVWLEEAGYRVDWDGPEVVTVIFDDE